MKHHWWQPCREVVLHQTTLHPIIPLSRQLCFVVGLVGWVGLVGNDALLKIPKKKIPSGKRSHNWMEYPHVFLYEIHLQRVHFTLLC